VGTGDLLGVTPGEATKGVDVDKVNGFKRLRDKDEGVDEERGNESEVLEETAGECVAWDFSACASSSSSSSSRV